MARSKGIIAYGNEQDRAKVAELAELEVSSVSEWIIRRIRKEYRDLFGDKNPIDTSMHQNS